MIFNIYLRSSFMVVKLLYILIFLCEKYILRILPCFRAFIKSFIQGFLPGIALKIFLIFLPTILMLMSKFEGFISLSSLERRSASRYYIFLFINVFLGSIITGTAFQQLNSFINQSANEYAPFILSYMLIGYAYSM